ncbi:hypothetical protein F4805DRAFT_459910 [Annulohypoxylon moriforme]|nr:hypothetical protein F4805DRAFT_459910 [Annulohypoxylon moriforme]
MASPETSPRSDLPQQKWYDIKLKDVIPRRGFVFTEGREIVDAGSDAIMKWAIESEVPNLDRSEVDEILADLMTDANAIADHYSQSRCLYMDLDGKVRAKPIVAILETACSGHKWVKVVPRQVFLDFIEELSLARSTYATLTRIRGMPEADKGHQGHLALAIDEWNGTSPVEDADYRYSQMPPHKIRRIINKVLGGDFADLELSDESFMGSDEVDPEDPKASWSPWNPSFAGTDGTSESNDEDAPWIHNYVHGSGEEGALGATNGFLYPHIHECRRLLRY